MKKVFYKVSKLLVVYSDGTLDENWLFERSL